MGKCLVFFTVTDFNAFQYCSYSLPAAEMFLSLFVFPYWLEASVKTEITCRSVETKHRKGTSGMGKCSDKPARRENHLSYLWCFTWGTCKGQSYAVILAKSEGTLTVAEWLSPIKDLNWRCFPVTLLAAIVIEPDLWSPTCSNILSHHPFQCGPFQLSSLPIYCGASALLCKKKKEENCY